MLQTGRNALTVEEFLAAGRSKLSLELAAGSAGLKKMIPEASLNRLGLALTGFFTYFAHRRVQILGNAELAYLASLEQGERRTRLARILACNVPCLVITRNRRIPQEVLELGEQARTPVLRSPMVTMNFINAATVMVENMIAPRVMMQGTMMEIHGLGVLLQGKHGVGKSEIALALIKRGHSLVSDDVAWMRLDSSGAVIGSAPEVTRYHMEIRGVGIIHVPSLFGVASVREEKKLDLIVQLSPSSESESNIMRDGQDKCLRNVLGVEIPFLEVPVAAGRDMSNVVETAAMDFRLRSLGHDAVKDLDRKLTAILTGSAKREQAG
jgi:HPr kinase/phosphorylase